MRKSLLYFATIALLGAGCATTRPVKRTKIPDEIRAGQIQQLNWGMFVCWSFSSMSNMEWTRGVLDPAYFSATGCDTDQWCEAAKNAEMTHILFLSKHHDGFCLWDTDTTELKVTNSPLGIDVLAKLKKSCDKYGLKLALYYSEGDWSYIKDMPRGKKGQPIARGDSRQNLHELWGSSHYPEIQKAQLKELCTRYGDIEYWWIDAAQRTGGLSHQEKVDWIRQFQPNSFVTFNAGAPAGRLSAAECGRPQKLPAERWHGEILTRYPAHEFTYPIQPHQENTPSWFCAKPPRKATYPAQKLYVDYRAAKKYGNIFDINVAPNQAGQLRAEDVKVLDEVGDYVRGERKLTAPVPLSAARAASSMDWAPAAHAIDQNQCTRWWPKDEDVNKPGWIEFDFAKPETVRKLEIDCGGNLYVTSHDVVLEYRQGDQWTEIEKLGPLNGYRLVTFLEPVTARTFRLRFKRQAARIVEANFYR